MTERELLTQVQAMWVTQAVGRSMVRSALDQAEQAMLVEPRQHGQRDKRWAVTDACAADAEQDRAWANKAIAAFEVQVGLRLDELSDQPVEQARVPRLTTALIGALIVGSHQVFTGVASAGERALHGRIAYDTTRARAHIDQRVHPPELAQVVAALAEAALDPADEFGTEIVRLIVQGQVLHGLLTRKDLGDQRLTSETLLLLDTSVLFYALEPRGPQCRVFEDFLAEAKAGGADVVVSRGVLDEWERVWMSADGEHRALMGDERHVPPSLAARLADNVVVREWFRADEFGDGPTWEKFANKHRNIERWLGQRGVRVLDESPADQDLVRDLCEALEGLSNASPRPLRTPTAARTDAESAALIRKWRQAHPSHVPLAWFVAQERLTGKAYRSVCADDAFPLNMPVEEGLLLLSAARIDDPEHRRELVEIVGDSVILGSFFSLTTGYGPEDLLAMVDLLSPEEEPLTDEEALDALRADYRALARASADPPAELLRRRAIRRDKAARRRLAEATEQQAQMDAKIAQAEDRVRAEETAKSEGLRATNQRLVRTIVLLLVLVALVTFVVWSFLRDVHPLVTWGGVAAVIIVAAEGIAWIVDRHMKTAVFVCSIVGAAAWSLVGGLVGANEDVLPNHQDSPSQTPSEGTQSPKSDK